MTGKNAEDKNKKGNKASKYDLEEIKKHLKEALDSVKKV